MRVLLSKGFSDSRLNLFFKNSLIDKKELEYDKIKQRLFNAKIIEQEYKKIVNSVSKNKKLKEEKIKLPEFNVNEFKKTGQISKELYNLLEYGSPFLGIPPQKIFTKLKNRK